MGKLEEKTQELTLIEGNKSVTEVINGVQNEVLDPEKVEEEIRSEERTPSDKNNGLIQGENSKQDLTSNTILENAHNTINMLNEDNRDIVQRDSKGH